MLNLPKVFLCLNSEGQKMIGSITQDISRFFIAGVNYKKTDAAIRGEFAISQDQYQRILDLAPSFGVNELFILSTCNRTEIYGLSTSAEKLTELLCMQTKGSLETFRSLCYIKQGTEAIEHLYQVGAGLDSQILGDYEIVGQIKAAVKFSRAAGFVGSFTERLVNSVLQSSKCIKNQTALSGGTVSVSFAAVQYIKEIAGNIGSKRILLVGTGKIGRNTCKNLVDYLDARDIVLINRSPEKALSLALETGVSYDLIENLSSQVAQADIIVVATNATEPTICSSMLEGKGSKLIIDLSIPYNVEASAQQLPGITLVNVDDLSRLKDATLQMREGEVPKAKVIISLHIQEFLEWHEHRKHVPVLKAVKLKLEEIHQDPIFIQMYVPSSTQLASRERIQRIINGMALKMRSQNQRGCHYIEAINEFMSPGAN